MRPPSTNTTRRTAALFTVPLAIALAFIAPASAAMAKEASSPHGYTDTTNSTIVSETTTVDEFPSSRGLTPATATYQLGPGSAVTNVKGGGLNPGKYSVISDDQQPLLDRCVPEDASVGSIHQCHDRVVTVTFSEPVINPQLHLGSNAGGSGTPGNTQHPAERCVSGWDEFRIAKINDGESAEGRVTPASIDNLSLLSGASLATDHDAMSSIALSADSCLPEYEIDGYPLTVGGILQLEGLVTSVEVAITRYEIVNRADAAGAFPVMVWHGGSQIQASIPLVDLALTKTASSDVVSPGSRITWTLEVTNGVESPVSLAPSHGFTVRDAVPENVSSPSLESAIDGCALSGRDLVCEFAPENCTVTVLDHTAPTAALECPNSIDAGEAMLEMRERLGPIIISANAPTTCSTPVTNTAYVVGVDADANLQDNSDTVTTTTLDTGCEAPPVVTPSNPPPTTPAPPEGGGATPVKPDESNATALASTGVSGNFLVLLLFLGLSGVGFGTWAMRARRS